MNRKIVSGVIVLAVIAAGLLVLIVLKKQQTAAESQQYETSVLRQQSTSPDIFRLKDGLIPPTNKWYSGLVFSKTPTVFSYPFSLRMSDNSSFEVGVPKVSSSSDVISAGHVADLRIKTEASDYRLEKYDDLSATVQYRKGDKPLLNLTLVQGSPYVYLDPRETTTVELKSSGPMRIERQEADSIVFAAGSQKYGLFSRNINSPPISLKSGYIELKLVKGVHLSVVAIPANVQSYDELISSANSMIEKTAVEYERHGSSFKTRFLYSTKNNQPTVFGVLESRKPPDLKVIGSFDTLYGELLLTRGNSYTSETPVPQINEKLDLSKLTETQKTDLQATLKEDVRQLSFVKNDSYFSGKEFYRAANLMMVADSLGDLDSRDKIAAKLSEGLAPWFPSANVRSDKFFYYDNILNGVAASPSSFGNDQFNDHHFHYGYFLYAASILTQHDPDFANRYGSQLDLLAADIASPHINQQFPRFRHFDYFAGHSWASGYGDFADGNNQESSSEAVNAWYAVYLWGRSSGNKDLENAGLWLYSNESRAARNFWLKDPLALAGAEKYSHPLVSLVWGGKRDYATFFSKEPQAITGIQLIPMSPAQEYLKDTDINTIAAAAAPSGQFQGQFSDYLIMYTAFADKQSAIQKLSTQKPSEIDDANSLSYLKAWVYSR